MNVAARNAHTHWLSILCTEGLTNIFAQSSACSYSLGLLMPMFWCMRTSQPVATRGALAVVREGLEFFRRAVTCDIGEASIIGPRVCELNALRQSLTANGDWNLRSRNILLVNEFCGMTDSNQIQMGGLSMRSCAALGCMALRETVRVAVVPASCGPLRADHNALAVPRFRWVPRHGPG